MLKKERFPVKQYAVVIQQTEGGFGAYVPDLPGCIAAGDTYAETEHLIRQAIPFHKACDGWRPDSRSPTLRPPPPKTIKAGRFHARPQEKRAPNGLSNLLRALTGHDLVHLVLQTQLLLLQPLLLGLVFQGQVLFRLKLFQ